MKKLILFAALLMAFAGAASAQFNIRNTTPRFDSTGITGDNTGRVLPWKYQSVFQPASNDTIYLRPSAYITVIKDTLVSVADSSSFVFKPSSVTGLFNSHVCDMVQVIIKGPSGGVANFYNSYPGVTVSSGRIVLGSGGVAIVDFEFDGYQFVEKSRSIH